MVASFRTTIIPTMQIPNSTVVPRTSSTNPPSSFREPLLVPVLCVLLVVTVVGDSDVVLDEELAETVHKYIVLAFGLRSDDG